MFRLSIRTDNAAFHEDDGEATPGALGAEVARILRHVARCIEDGAEAGDFGACADANGNTVGRWALTEEA